MLGCSRRATRSCRSAWRPRTPGEPSTLLTGEEERALSELRHFQRCMREKGYRAER